MLIPGRESTGGMADAALVLVDHAQRFERDPRVLLLRQPHRENASRRYVECDAEVPGAALDLRAQPRRQALPDLRVGEDDVQIDLVEVHLDALERVRDVLSDAEIFPPAVGLVAPQTRKIDLETIEFRDLQAEAGKARLVVGLAPLALEPSVLPSERDFEAFVDLDPGGAFRAGELMGELVQQIVGLVREPAPGVAGVVPAVPERRQVPVARLKPLDPAPQRRSTRDGFDVVSASTVFWCWTWIVNVPVDA